MSGYAQVADEYIEMPQAKHPLPKHLRGRRYHYEEYPKWVTDKSGNRLIVDNAQEHRMLMGMEVSDEDQEAFEAKIREQLTTVGNTLADMPSASPVLEVKAPKKVFKREVTDL
jgi:hypothetical protein